VSGRSSTAGREGFRGWRRRENRGKGDTGVTEETTTNEDEGTGDKLKVGDLS